MDKELNVISAESLNNVSESDINELIEQMVKKSNENMEEICELTFECTSLLTSAESRSKVLSDQGVLKRLVGDITGKNQKLQNAILQDNTNALYVAQGVINRVMLECTNNRTLLMAVNKRMNDLYLELQENQNDIAAGVLMIRKAFVAFYKEYQDEINKINDKVNTVTDFEEGYCKKCQSELLSWQKVCPNCGYIHPLKIKNTKPDTLEILKKISEIVNDKNPSDDIVWDLTAKKADSVLRKVSALAEIGQLPGYTEEVKSDVNALIRKCKDAEFQIAIVGVMKAGKSFLMNALIGTEIASVDVNPETAALTKFRSANGYYVIVKFYTGIQWNKLMDSVKDSNNKGGDSLAAKMKDPQIAKLKSEWVNHNDIKVCCDSLSELQKEVKKYTSSKNIEHLFVSEVEVGIDRNIFSMPQEVVFVDTPGLKDPVRYRSDITRRYIKKADAVLIALKPGPFTDEGYEIVSTVLDCVDKNKAYLIGTQKDLNIEEDCEKYVSDWVTKLVKAGRYKDKRQALNRIILTSAKMDLLVKKWISLSSEEREDDKFFSYNDFNALQSYSGTSLKRRGYNLMQISQDDVKVISEATGIPALRRQLDSSLIANYRMLKVEDIRKSFEHCKKQMYSLSKEAIKQQEEKVTLAKAGTEEIERKISDMDSEKKKLKQENDEIKKAADKLVSYIKAEINKL